MKKQTELNNKGFDSKTVVSLENKIEELENELKEEIRKNAKLQNKVISMEEQIKIFNKAPSKFKNLMEDEVKIRNQLRENENELENIRTEHKKQINKEKQKVIELQNKLLEIRNNFDNKRNQFMQEILEKDEL